MGCNTSSPTTSQPSPAAVLVTVIGARQTYGRCYGKMPDPSLGFGTGSLPLSECLPVPFCRLSCGGHSEYTGALKGSSQGGTAFPCWNHDMYFPLPSIKSKPGSPSSASRPGSRASSLQNRPTLDISIYDRNPRHLEVVQMANQSPTTTAKRGRASSTLAVRGSEREDSGLSLIGHAALNLQGAVDFGEPRRYWVPLEDSPSSGEVGLIVYPCCGIDLILQEVQFFHNVGRDGQATPTRMKDAVVDFNQLEMLKNFHFSVAVGQQPAQSTSQRKVQLTQRKYGWNRSMRFFLPACGVRRAHHVALFRLWTEDTGETDLGEETSTLVAACFILLPNLPKLNSEGAPTFLDGTLCNEEMKSVGHIRVSVSRCAQKECLDSLQLVLGATESRAALPPSRPQMYGFACTVLSAFNVAPSNQQYAKDLEQFYEPTAADKTSEEHSHSDEDFLLSFDEGISPSSRVLEKEPPFTPLQPSDQLELRLACGDANPNYSLRPVEAFSTLSSESEGSPLQTSTWNSTFYFGGRRALRSAAAPVLLATLGVTEKGAANPRRRSQSSKSIGSCQVSLAPFLLRGPQEVWVPLTNCRGELGLAVSSYHTLKVTVSSILLHKSKLLQGCEGFLGHGRPTGVTVRVTLSRLYSPRHQRLPFSTDGSFNGQDLGTHQSKVIWVSESDEFGIFKCQVDEEFRFHFPSLRSVDLDVQPNERSEELQGEEPPAYLQLKLVVSLASLFPSLPTPTGAATVKLGEVLCNLDPFSREVATGEERFLKFCPSGGDPEASSTEPVMEGEGEAPQQHGIQLFVLEEGSSNQINGNSLGDSSPLRRECSCRGDTHERETSLDFPSRPKFHLMDWEIVAARGLRPPLDYSQSLGAHLRCSVFIPLQGSLLKVDAPGNAHLVHPDFHVRLNGVPYPDAAVGRTEFRLELRNAVVDRADAEVSAGSIKELSLGSTSLDFASLNSDGLIRRGYPSHDLWLRLNSGGELCVQCFSQFRFQLIVSGLYLQQDDGVVDEEIHRGHKASVPSSSSSSLQTDHVLSVWVSAQGNLGSPSGAQHFTTATRRGMSVTREGNSPHLEETKPMAQWYWNEEFTFFSRTKKDDRLVFEIGTQTCCGNDLHSQADRNGSSSSSPLKTGDRERMFPFPLKGEVSLSAAVRGEMRCLDIPLYAATVAENGGRGTNVVAAKLRILLLEEGAADLSHPPIPDISEMEAKRRLDAGTVAAEQVSQAANEAADLVSRYLQALTKKN